MHESNIRQLLSVGLYESVKFKANNPLTNDTEKKTKMFDKQCLTVLPTFYSTCTGVVGVGGWVVYLTCLNSTVHKEDY